MDAWILIKLMETLEKEAKEKGIDINNEVKEFDFEKYRVEILEKKEARKKKKLQKVGIIAIGAVNKPDTEKMLIFQANQQNAY